jgi:microcystin-dependent protein
MAAPTPSQIRAVIANPSGTICANMVDTLLRLPELVYNWALAWINEDGTLTDAFIALIRKPGEISWFAMTFTSAQWLKCDGTEVAQATYPNLYAAIGNTFGTPTVGTNFVLPNLTNKVMVGAGGLYALAATGGEATHVLTTSEMPAHTHSITNTSSPGGATTPERLLTDPSATAVVTNINTGSAGSGGAHENMPPYLSLYAFIKT